MYQNGTYIGKPKKSYLEPYIILHLNKKIKEYTVIETKLLRSYGIHTGPMETQADLMVLRGGFKASML